MKVTKRIVSILILAAMLLSSMVIFTGTALAAGQDSSKAGWYYVVTKVPENHTYSYIYNKPSSSKSKNLGSVDDGERVYVYWVENGTGKKSSKWAYCEYDDIEGYIRWENLSVTKPVPKPTSTPQPSPAKGSYVVMSGDANIRSGAGKSYKTVGFIGKGKRAEYLDESRNDDRPVLWYKIRYNGKIGWVSSVYATLIGGSEPAESERIDCQDWYIVDTVVPAGYTYSYMYDAPSSTQGGNLGKVNDGEAVYAYWYELGGGDQNTYWAYCLYHGKKGYIRWDNLY